MKRKIMTPSNVNNSTIMDNSDNEMDEIPDKELKPMIIRMSNEIKEDINKCLNKFQEKTNS
jgi:hypothetical protein